MQTVNIHEAKTHLSRLLERVAAGEDIVIAKAARPVPRLIPFRETREQRVFGRDAGLFEAPKDFDNPLPEDVLTTFEQLILVTADPQLADYEVEIRLV